MSTQIVIKKTWLSQKPNVPTQFASLLLILVIILSYLIYQTEFLNSDIWMSANPKKVFLDHQYWRLWSTLFAHADFSHLASNLLLFIPFCYFLMGYFNLFLFPFLGLLVGGLINVFVLLKMPDESYILGISGVVSWMGATWLTLFLFIQRSESFRRRLAKVLVISIILFVPDKYDPQVSYYSHLLGYLFGVLSGVIYYYINKRKFLDAEEVELIDDEPQIFDYQTDIKNSFN